MDIAVRNAGKMIGDYKAVPSVRMSGRMARLATTVREIYRRDGYEECVRVEQGGLKVSEC